MTYIKIILPKAIIILHNLQTTVPSILGTFDNDYFIKRQSIPVSRIPEN